MTTLSIKESDFIQYGFIKPLNLPASVNRPRQWLVQVFRACTEVSLIPYLMDQQCFINLYANVSNG